MVDVLVVTSPACHLCEDALEALGELAPAYGLTVREIPIGSVEGQAAFERFRPPLPPFVIIDGELFSFGRLPRKKLRKHLERAKAVV